MSPPGEITLEVMQQILREVEKDSSIEVRPCIQVEELNDSFHGGSCISRVTLKYTLGGDKTQHSLTLIVKSLMNDSSNIIYLQKSTFFIREIQMFNEILPKMSTLLTRALPSRHKDFFPRVYYTRKTPSYLIALEDLSPKGFKAPKRKDGLNLKQCFLALRALARFHAASVMIRREDKSLFTVFDKYFYESNDTGEHTESMPRRFISMLAETMKSRKDFDPSWADRLQHRYKTLLKDLDNLRKRDDGRFNVLIHGDFALHNVMYRYAEPSGVVESVMLVDFQTCSYSSPAVDLQQFIMISANDDVRANHIGTLLREYHAELTTTLKSLGIPQEEIISLAQLLDEFDRMLPHGLFCATLTLPFLRFDLDNNSAVNSEDITTLRSDGMQKMQALITDSFLKTLRIQLPVFIEKNII